MILFIYFTVLCLAPAYTMDFERMLLGIIGRMEVDIKDLTLKMSEMEKNYETKLDLLSQKQLSDIRDLERKLTKRDNKRTKDRVIFEWLKRVKIENRNLAEHVKVLSETHTSDVYNLNKSIEQLQDSMREKDEAIVLRLETVIGEQKHLNDRVETLAHSLDSFNESITQLKDSCQIGSENKSIIKRLQKIEAEEKVLNDRVITMSESFSVDVDNLNNSIVQLEQRLRKKDNVIVRQLDSLKMEEGKLYDRVTELSQTQSVHVQHLGNNITILKSDVKTLSENLDTIKDHVRTNDDNVDQQLETIKVEVKQLNDRIKALTQTDTSTVDNLNQRSHQPNVQSAKSNVRLRGGITETSGRVEIMYNGVWHTVCDDNFGRQALKVVCRMIGIELYDGQGVIYNSAKKYGPGSGDNILDNVQCSGTETSILNCRGINAEDDCGHDEDIGVDCSGSTESKKWLSDQYRVYEEMFNQSLEYEEMYMI